MLQKIFYFCVLFSFLQLANGATNEINNATIEGFTDNATAIELLSRDNDTITTTAVEGINATTEGFTDAPTELLTNDTIATTTLKEIDATWNQCFFNAATGLLSTIIVKEIEDISIEGAYVGTGTFGNDTIITITIEITKAKCTKATKYTQDTVTLSCLLKFFVWFGIQVIAWFLAILLVLLLIALINRLLERDSRNCKIGTIENGSTNGSTKGSTQLLI